MNEYDVKRLALILAVQAEIEGLKTANKQRDSHGIAAKYEESNFMAKAEELKTIASKHNEQL